MRLDEEPMKVCFLPLGDENAASSRIRVYTLHETLQEMGVCSSIGYDSEADVVVIQKRVDRSILQLAARAKRNNKLVIYDIDDFGYGLEYCCSDSNLRNILKVADVITTDTQGHLEYLVKYYNVQNSAIIPDAIDYFPKGCARLPQKSCAPIRILWFGGMANISLFEKYALGLTEIADAQVVVATAVTEELKRKYPKIEFVPWSLSTFISVLQGCDLTCLMHDGSEIDKAKSNNKMITSICWGVPAIVSRTPDYQRTAIESEIEYAVFSNLQELIKIIELLRPSEKRAEYLERSQQVIWAQYSGPTVAQKYLELLAKGISTKEETSKNILQRFKGKISSLSKQSYR